MDCARTTSVQALGFGAILDVGMSATQHTTIITMFCGVSSARSRAAADRGFTSIPGRILPRLARPTHSRVRPARPTERGFCEGKLLLENALMPLTEPLDHLAVPADLVLRFVSVFARCEYAMKETGYKRDDNGVAAPAWQKLQGDARSWLTVESGSELHQAIELLRTKPPKVETFAAGWQPAAFKQADAVAQAIESARRVRNNLFHGGKHHVEEEAGRDEQLVRAALTLLLALVAQCPGDLRGAYENG